MRNKERRRDAYIQIQENAFILQHQLLLRVCDWKQVPRSVCRKQCRLASSIAISSVLFSIILEERKDKKQERRNQALRVADATWSSCSIAFPVHFATCSL